MQQRLRRLRTTWYTDTLFAKEKLMMKNVRVTFKKLDGVSEDDMKHGFVKPGYKFCGTHMIFNIKMDGKFTRKARLIADGHTTNAPSSIT